MRASLDQGDVHRPLGDGEPEAEETFVAEVVVETTVPVPQVELDHRVQVEVGPELPSRRRMVTILVRIAAKMDTTVAIASSILTIYVSFVDSLGTSHENAIINKKWEDEAEVEANLGAVVAEDEDVVHFEEGEEKVITLEKEL